jgi:putative flippase GtrA
MDARKARWSTAGQLLRFALVGGSGAVINFVVFALVHRLLQWSATPCAVLAFAVAVTWNFSLNRHWTFRHDESPAVAYLRGWRRYVTVNLMGLGVNLLALNSIIWLFGESYTLYGQAAGLVLGMLFNFQLARTRVFVHASPEA